LIAVIHEKQRIGRRFSPKTAYSVLPCHIIDQFAAMRYRRPDNGYFSKEFGYNKLSFDNQDAQEHYPDKSSAGIIHRMMAFRGWKVEHFSLFVLLHWTRLSCQGPAPSVELIKMKARLAFLVGYGASIGAVFMPPPPESFKSLV
jgi:hypothetical protein